MKTIIDSKSDSLRVLSTAIFSTVGRANVGEDTSFSNGGVPEEFVQFFVISNGQKNMSWDNSGLLVVLGGISSKFKNFSSEIFQDSCKIDWGSSTNSFSIMGMSEESSNSTDWELKSGSWWFGDGLWWCSFCLSWFSFSSCHFDFE